LHFTELNFKFGWLQGAVMSLKGTASDPCQELVGRKKPQGTLSSGVDPFPKDLDGISGLQTLLKVN